MTFMLCVLGLTADAVAGPGLPSMVAATLSERTPPHGISLPGVTHCLCLRSLQLI